MIPRLYVDASLREGCDITLSADQAHYLKNVLRRAPGEPVRVFNNADGEYDAVLRSAAKKSAAIRLGAQYRAPVEEPDLQLLFAPVKRGPLEIVVQKAVELGASRLRPVITARTTTPKLNIARLQAIAIEAAEQCGRLTIPSVDEPKKLSALLGDWDAARRIMFCDEAGDAQHEDWGGREGRALPALEALKAVDSASKHWAVMIGPEGGFTAEERKLLRDQLFVTPVTLGPRILRADSAAIAALALWQAALGDWRLS